jgi:hypothetical protein
VQILKEIKSLVSADFRGLKLALFISAESKGLTLKNESIGSSHEAETIPDTWSRQLNASRILVDAGAVPVAVPVAGEH